MDMMCFGNQIAQWEVYRCANDKTNIRVLDQCDTMVPKQQKMFAAAAMFPPFVYKKVNKTWLAFAWKYDTHTV